MAQSNAQRQRSYRKRHIHDINDEREPLERINMMVSLSTKNSLKRLASCYGVTQRSMLERIIHATTKQLLETLDGNQQNDFYDMKLTLRSNEDKTQSD